MNPVIVKPKTRLKVHLEADRVSGLFQDLRATDSMQRRAGREGPRGLEHVGAGRGRGSRQSAVDGESRHSEWSLQIPTAGLCALITISK